MAKFSLRIVDADYYLEKPIPNIDICFSECRNRDIIKVPVIRIFGSTPQGQKCCLHVHRVFPYFYILIPDDEIFPLDFGKKFASSLDMAVQVALGKAVSKQQEYVYSYEVVMKRPLYGYYDEDRRFLKVSVYNPGLITKISELLVNGAVMNQFFQPYETHIPYILQFFIDYNLHGMNLINLKQMMFRKPVPSGCNFNTDIRSPIRSPVLGSPTFSQTNYDVFNSTTVSGMHLMSDEISKQSTCVLECDALETDIMNRELIKDHDMNPGLKAIWEDEKQRRRENHESTIIELPNSQVRDRFKMTDEEKFQLERLRSLISERIAKLGSQYSSGRNSSSNSGELNAADGVEETNTVQECSGSSDQSLVDILVGMAAAGDDDDGEWNNSNTPLSETTMMNNGLDDEGNVNTEEEEDENVESMMMSQTLHGEQIHEHMNSKQDDKDGEDKRERGDEENILDSSWSDSFLFRIPQYDGSSDINNPRHSNENIYKPPVTLKKALSREKLSTGVCCNNFHRKIDSSKSLTSLTQTLSAVEERFTGGSSLVYCNSEQRNNNGSCKCPGSFKNTQFMVDRKKHDSCRSLSLKKALSKEDLSFSGFSSYNCCTSNDQMNNNKSKIRHKKSKRIPQFDGSADLNNSDSSSEDFKPASKNGIVYKSNSQRKSLKTPNAKQQSGSRKNQLQFTTDDDITTAKSQYFNEGKNITFEAPTMLQATIATTTTTIPTTTTTTTILTSATTAIAMTTVTTATTTTIALAAATTTTQISIPKELILKFSTASNEVKTQNPVFQATSASTIATSTTVADEVFFSSMPTKNSFAIDHQNVSVETSRHKGSTQRKRRNSFSDNTKKSYPKRSRTDSFVNYTNVQERRTASYTALQRLTTSNKAGNQKKTDSNTSFQKLNSSNEFYNIHKKTDGINSLHQKLNTNSKKSPIQKIVLKKMKKAKRTDLINSFGFPEDFRDSTVITQSPPKWAIQKVNKRDQSKTTTIQTRIENSSKSQPVDNPFVLKDPQSSLKHYSQLSSLSKTKKKKQTKQAERFSFYDDIPFRILPPKPRKIFSLTVRDPTTEDLEIVDNSTPKNIKTVPVDASKEDSAFKSRDILCSSKNELSSTSEADATINDRNNKCDSSHTTPLPDVLLKFCIKDFQIVIEDIFKTSGKLDESFKNSYLNPTNNATTTKIRHHMPEEKSSSSQKSKKRKPAANKSDSECKQESTKQNTSNTKKRTSKERFRFPIKRPDENVSLATAASSTKQSSVTPIITAPLEPNIRPPDPGIKFSHIKDDDIEIPPQTVTSYAVKSSQSNLNNFKDALYCLSFPAPRCEENSVEAAADIRSPEILSYGSPCPSTTSEEFEVVEQTFIERDILIPESPPSNNNNNSDSASWLPKLNIYGSPFMHVHNQDKEDGEVNLDDFTFRTPDFVQPASRGHASKGDTADFIDLTNGNFMKDLKASCTPGIPLQQKRIADCGDVISNQSRRKELIGDVIGSQSDGKGSVDVNKCDYYHLNSETLTYTYPNEEVNLISSEENTVEPSQGDHYSNNRNDSKNLEITFPATSKKDIDAAESLQVTNNTHKLSADASTIDKGTEVVRSLQKANSDFTTTSTIAKSSLNTENNLTGKPQPNINNSVPCTQEGEKRRWDETNIRKTLFRIKFQTSEDSEHHSAENISRDSSDAIDATKILTSQSVPETSFKSIAAAGSSKHTGNNREELISPEMYGQESFFYDSEGQSSKYNALQEVVEFVSIEEVEEEAQHKDVDGECSSTNSVENCEITSGVLQLSDTDEEFPNEGGNELHDDVNTLHEGVNEYHKDGGDSDYFLSPPVTSGRNCTGGAEANPDENIMALLDTPDKSGHDTNNDSDGSTIFPLPWNSVKPDVSRIVNEEPIHSLHDEKIDPTYRHGTSVEESNIPCIENKEPIAVQKEDHTAAQAFVCSTGHKTHSAIHEITKEVRNKSNDVPIGSTTKKQCTQVITIQPMNQPPSYQSVVDSLPTYNLPEKIYQPAFYGNDHDQADNISYFRGKHGVQCQSKLSKLPAFVSKMESNGALETLQLQQIKRLGISPMQDGEQNITDELRIKHCHDLLYGNNTITITPCKTLPSRVSVQGWLDNKRREHDEKHKKELPAVTATSKISTSATTNKVNDASSLTPTATQINDEAANSAATSISSQMKASIETPLRSKLNRTHTPKSLQLSFGIDRILNVSDIEGSSLNNTYGFDHMQRNLQDAKALHVNQHLTAISIELHTQTRRDMRPDPNIDGIVAVFFTMCKDVSRNSGSILSCSESGVFIFDPNHGKNIPQDGTASNEETKDGRTSCGGTQNGRASYGDIQDGKISHGDINKNRKSLDDTQHGRTSYSSTQDGRTSYGGTQDGRTNCDGNIVNETELMTKTGYEISFQRCYNSEKDMLLGLVALVQEIDPDFLIGYEVQMLSWGYIIERGAVLDLNMCQLLSRVVDKDKMTRAPQQHSENWFGQLVTMTITGRIILNVWRVMRSEVTLQIYSYENVSYHVLHRRVPTFSFRCLTEWWSSNHSRWRVCQHYIIRCHGNMKLLGQIDFIGRTSELARVFGILFYSVISRGTQFRVESMMLRTAKPLNYIPVSPSVHQRAKMSAPECIQLVMEPESQFYADPVIVLDFQSLYPSIIIAYNYCYSTCLGKVQSFAFNENYKFGATSLNLPLSVLKKLSNDNIHISPNGVGFVTSDVKRGVLPRMLEDILNTRIMVKNSMKKAKDDKALHRMLDSRQLGLKLIANVTYGYTSANYSGRMPCIEIGDSVVRKGRETLERAIHMVNNTKKWNAKVVYGDTDSMFVLAKGASKERCFRIAQEIVDEVTAVNPKPVKLKFEKVYQPCVLITKKRYVGYSYETLDQQEPIFDAKGIETVRRDNCPAVGKILEKSIRLLFETKNVSTVKSYVQSQIVKIMEGKATMKEFIFAKEYRGMSTYKPGACVPALVLAKKMLKQDRRSEPRIGQRVPYVIINGSPGLPLIQLVRTPMEVIDNPGLRLNEVYYITKQICPSLSRIFSLLGVNVNRWFSDLPKITRVQEREMGHANNKKGTISHYFTSQHCAICEKLTTTRLCSHCRGNSQEASIVLSSRILRTERRHGNLKKLCQHCAVTWQQETNCISLDCPVFFKLSNNTRDMKHADILRSLLDELKP